METKNLKNFPGIYIFKCLANGKHYIGESMNVRSRIMAHLRSDTQAFHKALKKYGHNEFELMVEYFPDFKKIDLVDLEETLIKRFESLSPNGYNICERGINAVGRKLSEETKRKISEKAKGRIVSDETRAKLKGYKHSDEAKLKMSIFRTGKSSGRKGKTNSPEMRAKQSASSKGHKKSDEFKLKLSAANKGKILSDETRKKISDTKKLRFAQKRIEA
jgi:predicted GIY-YIG superfamily endonuclease